MPTVDYSSYHQLSGTGADGTKFSNFVDAVQATVNALDKNNLAASAGILASQLADPTTGKVLGSSGGACAAVFPPGYEYAYAEWTSSVTLAALSQAASNTVVSAPSVTYDGSTAVWLEILCPYVQLGGATNWNLEFFDGTSYLGGLLGVVESITPGFLLKRRITPTAGAKTYSLKGYSSGAVGGAVVGAGAGGSAVNLPGYIRITKA